MLKLTFIPEFEYLPGRGIPLMPDMEFHREYKIPLDFDNDDGFNITELVQQMENDLKQALDTPRNKLVISENVKKEWVRAIYKYARDQCLKAGEDGPYSKEAIDLIKRLKPVIVKYAMEMDVNPIAVAGAIADEYSSNYDLEDHIQDNFLTLLPNLVYETTMKGIKKGKIEKIVKEGQLGYLTNWAIDCMNSVIGEYNLFLEKFSDLKAHDFGKGNIQLRYALELQNKYSIYFPEKMLANEMAGFLTTDRGMVMLASLAMKDAKEKLANTMKQFDKEEKIRVAFLITAYKQGTSELLESIREKERKRMKYKPGEGAVIICRWVIFEEIFN